MARRRLLLALLCLGLLWSLPGAPAVAPAAVSTSGARPDGTVSVDPPAEVPVLVRSSPRATDARITLPTSPAHDGPPPAVTAVVFDAYRLAAAVAPASCHLDVSLLAAIGQVESGNLAGHALDEQHRATPAVLGPVLDGTGDVRAIRDTDAGELDGDTTWDRAVGPMQFLPSTWRLSGIDLDADGLRDPQDIEDAAGAAMVYLCGAGGDLATAAGLEAAVLAYNHSAAYLRLVLAWKHAYDLYGVRLAELPPLHLAAVRLFGHVRSQHSEHVTADPGPQPQPAAQGPVTSPAPASSQPPAATTPPAPTTGTPPPPTTAAPTTGTPSPTTAAPTTGTPSPTTAAPTTNNPDSPAPPPPAEDPAPADSDEGTAPLPTCTEPAPTDPEDQPATSGEPAPAGTPTGDAPQASSSPAEPEVDPCGEHDDASPGPNADKDSLDHDGRTLQGD